jgi:hypothetical protein
VRFISEQGWEADEDEAQRTVKGEFLTEIAHRINERALESLGDKLIFLDGSTVTVAEDYQDELAHLLTHILEPAASSESLTVPEIEVPLAATLDYSDLTPEWAAFAQRMQPQHWEALNVLLLGEDVVVRLDGVARSVNTMVSLMINDINDIALSSVGDIVINSSVEPPTIEEEDMDGLRALNTWALQHRLQEL